MTKTEFETAVNAVVHRAVAAFDLHLPTSRELEDAVKALNDLCRDYSQQDGIPPKEGGDE